VPMNGAAPGHELFNQSIKNRRVELIVRNLHNAR
jgi:hypothetical protein